MLGWAITFLIIALVAAVFGFGGIAGTAVEIAKLIFFVAIGVMQRRGFLKQWFRRRAPAEGARKL